MDTVNSQTTGNQSIGTVAALDGGGYVIAWRGVAYGGEAIWFQRYDAEGAKVGAETWAKDVDPASKEAPLLIAFEGGRFQVSGQNFDAAGIPVGTNGSGISLATRYGLTPENQHLSESDPTIAGLPGGGYVTVESKTIYVENYPGQTFVIRWFNEAGQQQRQYERPPESAEMAPVESLHAPAITVLADGKVLVTWQESGRRSAAAEFDLFSADGQLLRHEVIALQGGIGHVEATPLPNGGFVVSWAGASYLASPDAYYRQYDASGARVGEDVNLGPVTYGSQSGRVASTTTLENGDVVLVFEVLRPSGTTDVVAEHLDLVGAPPPPPSSGDGQVINSPGPGSTLQGGSGNDTLHASQGPDVLTGGGGGDVFAWAALPWNAGRVTDFNLGSDRLDLSVIFRASGYTGSDPVADGRMRLDSDGAGGTKVYFDPDAPNAGDWPFLITTLENVISTGLTWAQLSGGSAPPPGDRFPAIQGGGTGSDLFLGVNEANLTGGTSPDPAAVVRTGSVTLRAEDGLDDFKVAGQSVITDGVFTAAQVTLSLGNTLEFTSFNTSTGALTFRYTLAAAEDHANGYASGGRDRYVNDDGYMELTDRDGDRATGLFRVVVKDDVPVAHFDTDFTRAGELATGNIISDAAPGDGGDSDTGFDLVGADGAFVARVIPYAGSADLAGPSSQVVVAGRYGDLTISGMGDYSYAARTDAPAGATEIFQYVLRDGDGSPMVTPGRLTITIDGAPPPSGGQVINSPGPGSTLQGGAGADTLNASQGPDQLTGGGAGDHFVFAKPPWNAGLVTDFTPGSDKVDVSALLDAYTGSNPMADGWLRLDNAGGSTKVYVDIDGAGGEWPFLITTLQGVAPTSLTLGDFIL